MKPNNASENLEAIVALKGQLGVDLVSSALVNEEHRGNFHESIRELSSKLPYAVSIGIRLSEPVLATVRHAPSWTYYYHYRMVNTALDQAALRVAGFCMERGASAFPVPASQILDWERNRAHLSHREIAWLAGLGWHGRNNLLVNQAYGSQVRYATVLTDLPLPERAAESTGTGCGDCRRCLNVCPVEAIHDTPDDFELDRCVAQLRRFAKSEKINTMICGICIRVCRGSTRGREAGEGKTG